VNETVGEERKRITKKKPTKTGKKHFKTPSRTNSKRQRKGRRRQPPLRENGEVERPVREHEEW